MKLKDFWRWADEDENGCWIWQQSKNDGYGVAYLPEIQKIQMKAHRVAWFLTHGEWPENGMLVCHKCDVRACVKPDHLFVATNKENVHDRVAKGRTGGHRERSLTKEQADEIRARKESSRVLGVEYGVSHSTILEIRRGNRYLYDDD